MIIDTHCHLYDECYDDKDQLISSLAENNIKSAFVVGTDLDTCKKALSLAHKHDNLFAILGMYPEYASQYDTEFEDFLIKSLSDSKVVAVGEIGLDFHSENFDKDLQKEIFSKQIKIAHRFNLPLSIHTRDAFEETLNVLKENKEYLCGGVIHCYSGSPEIAKEFVKLGFMLGFGGVCTFKNAKKVVETLKIISVNDILLETDAPYLAPTPHRGERNEPKYTNIILDKIAEIRGEDKELLENQIFQNTLKTFKRYKG